MTPRLKSVVTMFLVGLAVISVASLASDQAIRVDSSPRPFAVVSPQGWKQQPTTTGNSRVKFASPAGTPNAECAVIVQELSGLKGLPQSYFDEQMLQPSAPREIELQLSSRYNNVKVVATGVANISGHPAELSNVRYSVGTPAGELWARGLMVSTGTTPGLVWTSACGGLGRNVKEADAAYSYWQSEIMRFHTNIKILR